MASEASMRHTVLVLGPESKLLYVHSSSTDVVNVRIYLSGLSRVIMLLYHRLFGDRCFLLSVSDLVTSFSGCVPCCSLVSVDGQGMKVCLP